MQAFYDHQPSKVEAIGNGSYFYRFNIQEVEVESIDGAENRTQWVCEEVIVWGKPSSNAITEAVIGEKWDSNYEQKLVNEYNGVSLGLYGSTSSDEAKARKQAYKDFLQERAAIKAQIDADCEELGID